MEKESSSIFSGYKMAIGRIRAQVRAEPGRAALLGLPLLFFLAQGPLSLWIEALGAGKELWAVGLALGTAALGAVVLVPAALGLASGVSPRHRPDRRLVLGILGTWALASLVLAAKALLFYLPAYLPPLVFGFFDGFGNPLPQDPRWAVYTSVASSVMGSVLGFFYLWTYPVALVFPEAEGGEVQRWSEGLSARTWPLAAAFGLWTLAGTLWFPQGWPSTLWAAFNTLLSLAFFGAQVLFLADRARDPGFGP